MFQAKLLRQVGIEIENADAELAVFMSFMLLDDIPFPDHHTSLPQVCLIRVVYIRIMYYIFMIKNSVCDVIKIFGIDAS